jgi:hypothetical protein
VVLYFLVFCYGESVVVGAETVNSSCCQWCTFSFVEQASININRDMIYEGVVLDDQKGELKMSEDRIVRPVFSAQSQIPRWNLGPSTLNLLKPCPVTPELQQHRA